MIAHGRGGVRVGRRFTTTMNSGRNKIKVEKVDVRMTVKFSRRTDFT